MASFVIHNIAGEEFLKTIQNRLGISLSTEEQNLFLMGNLIVDSTRIKSFAPQNISGEELKKAKYERRISIQKEKNSTHFRDPKESDLTIQAPKVEHFIAKYDSLFSKDISVLGYLFHLYTDVIFFKDLFEKTFICLDSNGNPTIYYSKTTSLELKKDKKKYPASVIFSNDSEVSIYQDYTKMSALFLNQFNTTFDYDTLVSLIPKFINPGIEEVDYENILSVLNKTSSFIKESYSLEDFTLRVFDENVVRNFISETISSFIERYEEIILKSIHPKEEHTLLKRYPY